MSTGVSLFVNGAFVDPQDAKLSALDAGLQHGVGVFETMRAINTPEGVAVHDLDAHLDRLQASAAELGLSDELKTGPLGDAVRETASKAGGDRLRIRLTVTGGDLNMLQGTGRSGHQATVMVQAQPATPYPDAMFEQGVAVSVAQAQANPMDPTASHKTLNYWWRLRELQLAGAKGASEAIVFQVTNHVCGGCVSNLFARIGETLITPTARGEEQENEVPSPVLPGITRMRVIEAAKERGIAVETRQVSAQDLLGASEIFLTNSSWGVLPVVRLEAETIGNGKVGELSSSMRAEIG